MSNRVSWFLDTNTIVVCLRGRSAAAMRQLHALPASEVRISDWSAEARVGIAQRATVVTETSNIQHPTSNESLATTLEVRCSMTDRRNCALYQATIIVCFRLHNHGHELV